MRLANMGAPAGSLAYQLQGGQPQSLEAQLGLPSSQAIDDEIDLSGPDEALQQPPVQSPQPVMPPPPPPPGPPTIEQAPTSPEQLQQPVPDPSQMQQPGQMQPGQPMQPPKSSFFDRFNINL